MTAVEMNMPRDSVRNCVLLELRTMVYLWGTLAGRGMEQFV